MDKHVTPDHVPQDWAIVGAPAVCSCAVPVPKVRAARKGAARTHCARCGLPIRIDFDAR